jgi:hypothetical protein
MLLLLLLLLPDEAFAANDEATSNISRRGSFSQCVAAFS